MKASYEDKIKDLKVRLKNREEGKDVVQNQTSGGGGGGNNKNNGNKEDNNMKGQIN